MAYDRAITELNAARLKGTSYPVIHSLIDVSLSLSASDVRFPLIYCLFQIQTQTHLEKLYSPAPSKPLNPSISSPKSQTSLRHSLLSNTRAHTSLTLLYLSGNTPVPTSAIPKPAMQWLSASKSLVGQGKPLRNNTGTFWNELSKHVPLRLGWEATQASATRLGLSWRLDSTETESGKTKSRYISMPIRVLSLSR